MPNLHPDDDAIDWIQTNYEELVEAFLQKMDLKNAFDEYCQNKFEESLQYYNDDEVIRDVSY